MTATPANPMPPAPPVRIWIVTPSYNQAAYLRETVDSVRSQIGPFVVRHLVIDGGSDDGTVPFLRSVTDPRLTWISEPDDGQSDAVNKGLALVDMAGSEKPLADGHDVVGWLNSDDLYRPGALAAVARTFADPAARWAVGRYRVIDAAGRNVRRPVVRYKERQLRRHSFGRLLRQNFIPQPAVFWRASFGRSVGRLDPSLHYTMDYDLWLRMAAVTPPTVVDAELAAFRVHGTSKTGRINRAQFDEGYAVAARYANGRRGDLIAHRLHVEKIVWAYRLLQRLGR